VDCPLTFVVSVFGYAAPEPAEGTEVIRTHLGFSLGHKPIPSVMNTWTARRMNAPMRIEGILHVPPVARRCTLEGVLLKVGIEAAVLQGGVVFGNRQTCHRFDSSGECVVLQDWGQPREDVALGVERQLFFSTTFDELKQFV